MSVRSQGNVCVQSVQLFTVPSPQIPLACTGPSVPRKTVLSKEPTICAASCVSVIVPLPYRTFGRMSVLQIVTLLSRQRTFVLCTDGKDKQALSVALILHPTYICP